MMRFKKSLSVGFPLSVNIPCSYGSEKDWATLKASRSLLSWTTFWRVPKARAPVGHFRAHDGQSPLSTRLRHPSHLAIFPVAVFRVGIPYGHATAQVWQPMHNSGSEKTMPSSRFCMAPVGHAATHAGRSQ